MRATLPMLAAGLAAAVLAVRCGKPAEPPPRPERELPRVATVEVPLPASAAESADFEVYLWPRGQCALEINASGRGQGGIIVESENGARTPLFQTQLDNEVEARTVAFPEGPLRPVKLYLHGDKQFRWRGLRLHLQAAPQPASSLSGALRGADVLVFVLDALSARHLGAHGSPRATSPTLDRLAREGVRFSAARAQTSWTLPSVVTIFTGLDQETHGVLHLGQALAGQQATLGRAFRDQGYRTAALVQNPVVQRESGFALGMEIYETFDPLTGLDALLERAIALANESEDERPLFLYAHIFPPHGPYVQAPGGQTDFDPGYAGPVDGSITALKELLARHLAEPLAADHPDVLHLAALYDDAIRHVDRKLGAALASIEQADAARARLCAVLSDHGEAFLEHGAVGHEAQVYDEMVHVPWILWAPGSGLPAGRVVDAPASLLDVLPTLADLCELEHAPHPAGGRSLLPAIEAGAVELVERPLFLSSRYRPQVGTPWQVGVSFAGYKLVRTTKDGVERHALFDLAADPSEARDLAPALPLRAAAMRHSLEGWRAKKVGVQKAPALDPEIEADLGQLGYFGEH